MQIVIDISEEKWKSVLDGTWCGSDEIAKGIPICECEDCISRQDAMCEIKWLEEYGLVDMGVLIDHIREMPSVTPARKKGKWITIHEDEEDEQATGFYRCSCCKDELYDITKYCPSCGSYNGG